MSLIRGRTARILLIVIVAFTSLYFMRLWTSVQQRNSQGYIGPGLLQPTITSTITSYDENITGTEGNDVTTAEDVTYAVTTRIPDFEPMYFGENSNKDGMSDPSNVKIENPDESDKVELRKILHNVFKSRKARLNQFCGRRRGWQWKDSMQALAVPEKDLVVCAVQKAGSTAWHQLVHNIRNPGKEWIQGERMENWNYAWGLIPEERKRLMNSENVTRVITTRHPFARLVSAWNNKFEKSYFAEKGEEFVESMPGLEAYIGRHATDDNHTIAFEDLAQYIADVGLESVNVHLKSVELLCSPCDFPYDYVIKAETAPEYSWFVTEKIDASLPDFTRHAPAMDEFSPDKFRSYSLQQARHEEEKRIISRLFRKVPRDTIRVLMALYAADFAAFGYTFNASTLEAGGYS